MITETTTSTQEPMSLAKAHEWKYLAQKAMAQRDKALARAETAEAALAAAAVPCECGMAHHGFLLHGHRYCPNCGHPVEVAP